MIRPAGKVYLVGAGPGDPELLTVRGRELLNRADVVVYDSLVNDALLAHAPQAEHIFVGKRPDAHPMTQDDICRLLVEQTRDRASVVRLKGGDPFVFGRGGEEALALARADVPFEVVPGVTAGLGAAAYAGIPVTHRGVSGSVTFVTGHRTADASLDLSRVHLDGTLVFYMGIEHLEENLRRLRDAGRPGSTPTAIVERGTQPGQRVVTGTLDTIAQQAQEAKIVSPSLVIVGETVELRDTISWFEQRPLYGRRVCVTRTRRRAGELVHLLNESGAEVFEFPTVEIEQPDGPALGDLQCYDWIVFTSVNGVDTLFERMKEEGVDARSLHGVRLCAISSRTAEALAARGLLVDLAPSRYESEVVLAELEAVGGDLSEAKMLMPRADIGRSTLPPALRERGAEVTELQAYRTVVPRDAATFAQRLVEFAPDYVVFGSASAARNLAGILGPEGVASLARNAVFAAIGPIAAKDAESAGMPPEVVPDTHRIPDLVAAIAHFDAEKSTPP